MTTISTDRREDLLDLAAEYDDSPIHTGTSMAGDAIRELLEALERAEAQVDAALDRALQLGDELVDSQHARYRAEARIQAVRELHRNDRHDDCTHCDGLNGMGESWPCPTIRTLDQ